MFSLQGCLVGFSIDTRYIIYFWRKPLGLVNIIIIISSTVEHKDQPVHFSIILFKSIVGEFLIKIQ